MTRQQDNPGTTKQPDDMPMQHQVTDPITGTTAAGPLESDDDPRASEAGGWGNAAQWLGLALLLVAASIVVYWISAWR